MRKILAVVFSAVMMLALAACGNKVDDATAEKYSSKAEEVILLLNEGKYEEVHAMFNDEMEAGLSAAQMEELTPIISESGNFEKISKSSVEERDGYYVTVSVGKYSKKNRVFTISFDKNDEIAGLYIK